MTRDEIIKMAREAGGHFVELPNGNACVFGDEHLERFFHMAQAAEREKVANWMMRQGYATGHGDTVEDLLKELEWQVKEREREACAKVCEDKNTLLAWPTYAAAIRARGNT